MSLGFGRAITDPLINMEVNVLTIGFNPKIILFVLRGRESNMTNINKNSIYKIERGIPLPSNRRGGKWAILCSQMNDGDSVVVANHNEVVNMRQAIIRSKKNLQPNNCLMAVIEFGNFLWNGQDRRYF